MVSNLDPEVYVLTSPVCDSVADRKSLQYRGEVQWTQDTYSFINEMISSPSLGESEKGVQRKKPECCFPSRPSEKHKHWRMGSPAALCGGPQSEPAGKHKDVLQMSLFSSVNISYLFYKKVNEKKGMARE